MTNYTVENRLREPSELYSAIVMFASVALILKFPHVFLLSNGMAKVGAFAFAAFGACRLLQALSVLSYQKRLLVLKKYSLGVNEVPHSRKWLFMGKGFLWRPTHTQRIEQIKQIESEKYLTPSLLYRVVRKYEDKLPSFMQSITKSDSCLNPFRPIPDVGGKPYLHGVGDKEKNIRLPQGLRSGHTIVFGTTRVGKTRLASILLNQDIRNGEAVIFIDPKGDLDIMKDMYAACAAAGRLDDFNILHLGFPELSCHYNPISHYQFVSEVATRIANAISAGGDGAIFKDFAWKYLNIVATCLETLGEEITYKTVAFYVTHLDELLVLYADKVLAEKESGYKQQVQTILEDPNWLASTGKNKKRVPSRSDAVKEYLQRYIEKKSVSKKNSELHDDIIVELFNAATLDRQYYDKITASVGPVLAKINQSAAADIFSFTKGSVGSEISLGDIIKQKKVLYVGLDALSNDAISRAVGMAMISDLVSTSGSLYKEAEGGHSLCLHADEFSEVIQEQFITLLNKAGGSGIKVTAYSQTINDIKAMFYPNVEKAKMAEGNLNTLIMMRVKNEDTAKLLVNQLPQVEVVSKTQVSMASDTPHGDDGVYFNTTNEDRVTKTQVPMLAVNDIVSLPKGQAFVFLNGGELYKVRLPLPKATRNVPETFAALMQAVNKVVLNKEEIKEDISNDGAKDIVSPFKQWLETKIKKGSKKFQVNDGGLIFMESLRYGNSTVFVTEALFSEYEESTDVHKEELLKALSHEECMDKKMFEVALDKEIITLRKLVAVSVKVQPYKVVNIQEKRDA